MYCLLRTATVVDKDRCAVTGWLGVRSSSGDSLNGASSGAEPLKLRGTEEGVCGLPVVSDIVRCALPGAYLQPYEA